MIIIMNTTYKEDQLSHKSHQPNMNSTIETEAKYAE